MTSFVFALDMVQTLALAAVILFIGYGVRRRVGVLNRYNIPAPVVGGFLFAAVALTLRLQGGQRVMAHVPSHHDHEVGEWIGVRVQVDHVVTFARESVSEQPHGQPHQQAHARPHEQPA
jgi:MFS superfamily sulfate permease-like transporter